MKMAYGNDRQLYQNGSVDDMCSLESYILERETVSVNLDEIFSYLSNRVILVTGGGGSIGSELCRQISKSLPRQLIVFDIYENNAYDIEQELRAKHPGLNLTVLIGSVRDQKRLNSIFEKYCPEIVFHAAAHKHVPLMEASPDEAVKNNVMGTYYTACAALAFHCRRFILVSTDKACEPQSAMGASKRICEMIMSALNLMQVTQRDDPEVSLPPFDMFPRWRNSRGLCTDFIAVRFGNVVGSNGSIVPLFLKQIAAGGPVTVTHPEATRYFMTISEAVSLILQASAFAKKGEIYALDMGTPLKIDSIARKVIRFQGYCPEADIPIVYVGLRDGDRLSEIDLMKSADLIPTESSHIYAYPALSINADAFFRDLQDLIAAVDSNRDLCAMMFDILRTYNPA